MAQADLRARRRRLAAATGRLSPGALTVLVFLFALGLYTTTQGPRLERHSITFAGAARPHLDFWWLQGGTRALLASLGALVSSVAAATLALRCRRCDSSPLPS